MTLNDLKVTFAVRSRFNFHALGNTARISKVLCDKFTQ